MWLFLCRLVLLCSSVESLGLFPLIHICVRQETNQKLSVSHHDGGRLNTCFDPNCDALHPVLSLESLVWLVYPVTPVQRHFDLHLLKPYQASLQLQNYRTPRQLLIKKKKKNCKFPPIHVDLFANQSIETMMIHHYRVMLPDKIDVISFSFSFGFVWHQDTVKKCCNCMKKCRESLHWSCNKPVNH